MIIKILSIGSGALGSFYSGFLAKNSNVELTMLCRSDYLEVKKSGIFVQSHYGDYHYNPHKVIKDISEIGNEKPDFICVFLKALPDVSVAKIIANVVGENTVIVLIQNGFDLEEKLHKEFPKNEIIGGLAFICCTRLCPGKISHTNYGVLRLGTFNSTTIKNVELLKNLFISGGGEAEIVPSLRQARWEKLVWNAPFNPLSVIFGGVTTDLIVNDENSVKLSLKIMQEIIMLAKIDGISLPEAIDEKNLNSTRNMQPYKTSMCLDFENNRPMEVDAILKGVVEFAQQKNAEIPYLFSIFTILSQINKRNLNS